ncbi:MAG: hypothetical protein KJ749_08415 [Planctomycetes bacterium]|nr:hypothetical protein [Planctomycetota bacterium]
MAAGTFITAVNCMDGRVQEPVVAWMKQRFEADYVDMITEPGPDRIMTAGPPEERESIRRRVDISVNVHHSRVVAMVVHHDCAGFPVSRPQHLAALQECINTIESWVPEVRVLGLWVGEDWQVELISDSHGASSSPP